VREVEATGEDWSVALTVFFFCFLRARWLRGLEVFVVAAVSFKGFLGVVCDFWGAFVGDDALVRGLEAFGLDASLPELHPTKLEHTHTVTTHVLPPRQSAH